MWFSECTQEHMCWAFRNFFVSESAVHRSSSSADPPKGRSTGRQFPDCLFPAAHIRGTATTALQWRPPVPRMRAWCIPEKARVVVFSLLLPTSSSQPDNRYLKVEQQQTTELLSFFHVNGNYIPVTRGAGFLGLLVWKIKMLLGPTWVLRASTQGSFLLE